MSDMLESDIGFMRAIRSRKTFMDRFMGCCLAGLMGLLVLLGLIIFVIAVSAFATAVGCTTNTNSTPLVRAQDGDAILVTHYGEWGRIDDTIEATSVEQLGDVYVVTDKHTGARREFLSDISVEAFYGWTAKKNDSD